MNYLHNTNTNKIIIPWSGGVDSTAIIFEVLRYIKYNKTQTQNIKLHLVSVKADDERGLIESTARTNILKYIKKKYNKKIYNKIIYTEVSKSFSADSFKTGDLPQPYWWITHIFSYYGSSFSLLLGYHKGDDFWCKYNKFDKLIETSKEYFSNQENQYIYYPLCRMYKDEVHNLLPKKVKKMVRYCENYIHGKPCKKCGSCITHNKFIKRK